MNIAGAKVKKINEAKPGKFAMGVMFKFICDTISQTIQFIKLNDILLRRKKAKQSYILMVHNKA